MSKTFVITGATGFLGGRLAEILRERGDTVVALGRNAEQGKKLTALGATFEAVALGDTSALEKIIPEGATLVHCAALSSPWGKYSDFYQSNVVGTQNIAEVARLKHAERFIHISTPSIYVERSSKFGIREQDPLPAAIINDYAQTKLLAENAIDDAVALGLPAVTLRPQGIFGAGDPSILPRLIRVAKKGFIPVIGREEVQIDLTHVDNVCDAIICAANAGVRAIGQKYNITNDEPVDQKSTLLAILGRLGFAVKEKHLSLKTAENMAKALEAAYRNLPLRGEPLLTRYSVYTLAFSRTLNIDAAKKDLGYSPQVSMNDGIERYVKWYKKLHS